MSPAPLTRQSPFLGLERNIGELIREGIPDPVMLLDGLMYEGCSHWLSGHPKDGKTLIAMHFSIEVMKLGKPIIWLDYENGPRRLAKRFEAMNVRPDVELEELLDELFWYQYAAQVRPQDPELTDDLKELVKEHPDCVVIFDSQAKALATAGLSEDKADEVTLWTTKVVLELTNRLEATTVVIDHERKDANAGSRYSRGSGAKAADADVSWYVEALDPHFDREQPGVIKLTRRHDRDGYLPYAAAFNVGDGEGGLPIERMDEVPSAKPKTDSGKADIVRILADGVPRHFGELHEAAGGGEAIARGTFNKSLKALVDDGKVVKKGEGKQTTYEAQTAPEVPL